MQFFYKEIRMAILKKVKELLFGKEVVYTPPEAPYKAPEPIQYVEPAKPVFKPAVAKSKPAAVKPTKKAAVKKSTVKKVVKKSK